MKKITVWLNALWHWLGEARPAWIGGGGFVLVVALVFALISGTSESKIRLTGMFLQLLGIVTVVWGIEETRKLFKRPSVLDATSKWIRRFPVIGGRSITVTVGPGSFSLAGSGSAFVTLGANPDTSVEKRIEVLEKNIARINERISQTQVEIDQMKTEAQGALKREEQARKSEDTEIRTKLEATETGGLSISAIGAVWVFVGVILSASSVEIAHIFR